MTDHNNNKLFYDQNKLLRVLLVEDSADDVALIIRQLRKDNYDPDFQWVDNLQDLKEVLREKTWDIVLSDYVLPNFDGLAALRTVHDLNPDLIFILVSGRIGEEKAVEMMKTGAYDCIMKDRLPRLGPAVERALHETALRREREKASKALHLANEQLENRVHEATAELARRNEDLRRELKKRSETEQRLAEEERRFKFWMEETSSMFWTASPDGSFQEPNPGHEAYTGQPWDEYKNLGWMNSVYLEDRQRLRDCLGSATENKSVLECELRLWNKARQAYRWVLVRGVPEFNADGSVRRWIGISIDVDERKQAEEALKESESKYSVLVEQAMDGVFIAQDEIFKFVNEAFAKMHGYSREELIGRSSFIGIPPENIEELKKIYLARLRGEKVPGIYEVRSLAKDGRRLDLEVSAKLIHYQGRPAVMGIVRDITERKKIEQQLLRVDKLESLGLLAGGIAHDFNNLLTGIMGNISLAKIVAGPNRRTVEILENAENAAMQAKGLAQQLLSFSRGGEPVKKPVYLRDYLRETASLPLRGTGIAPEFHIAQDLWPVNVDEGQLGQVINNLIVNAVQAMPHGGTVRISAENVFLETGDRPGFKEGRYVLIAVQDQGVGIPEKYLGKIFDPYFTTKEDGKGLGLSIVQSIIRKHYGHIEVDSKPGAGATFRIYLPALFSADIEKAKKGEAEQEEAQPFHARILLMEDEEIVRNIAKAILEHFGYRVSLAENGREAIQDYMKAKMEGDPFDAVILDLTVQGGMDGREAIKELRSLDPQVNAIVSSGYTKDPIMTHYRDYGFNGAIAKPYNASELEKTLREVISAKKPKNT